MKIPFNKPFLTGKETHYIYQAVQSGKISGNGKFTQLCHEFFRQRYGFEKALLTTSCTDALEMCALLLNIEPGDEVVVPSYTFVSTANAFVLRGASIKFADSYPHHPNIDPASIASLITDRTKAIVVVHYAGVACDMDAIKALSRDGEIAIVEDAAQAIDATYKGRALGSIGDLAAFSFHETKNIISGEGGLLIVNNQQYAHRAEIIWEKGTNRAAFFRGEIDKYGWVDLGSSFLPSEVVAAFLYAQLETLEDIQARRVSMWHRYLHNLKPAADEHKIFEVPYIPPYSSNNAHMFYIILPSLQIRQDLIDYLRERGIHSVFHYLSLHKSPFFKDKYAGAPLPNSDRYADTLLRLPLFYELEHDTIDEICAHILDFLKERI